MYGEFSRVFFIITGLLFLVVVCEAPFQAQRRKPKSSTTAPAATAGISNNIRQVDFKNFTYHFAGETLRLRQGKEIIRDGTDTNLESVIYGDLTGDGQDEALVLLWQRNHVSARSEDSPLFVFTLRNGQPVALPVPELEGLITEINIKDGLLVVEHGDLLHGRPVRLRNFRRAGSAFEEVDAAVLPDSKTHYLVKLFGCDDSCGMKINGDEFEFLSTAFGEDTAGLISLKHSRMAGIRSDSQSTTMAAASATVSLLEKMKQLSSKRFAVVPVRLVVRTTASFPRESPENSLSRS